MIPRSVNAQNKYKKSRESLNGLESLEDGEISENVSNGMRSGHHLRIGEHLKDKSNILDERKKYSEERTSKNVESPSLIPRKRKVYERLDEFQNINSFLDDSNSSSLDFQWPEWVQKPKNQKIAPLSQVVLKEIKKKKEEQKIQTLEVLIEQPDFSVDTTSINLGRAVLCGDGWRRDKGQKVVNISWRFSKLSKPKDPRPDPEYVYDFKFR